MATKTEITSEDFPEFERRLKHRRNELQTEVGATLQRADAERHPQVAGDVHDEGDSALADVVIDVNNAEVARDINEGRAIEAALQRIADGKYGECIDCGNPIPRNRLEVAPEAARCIECQARFERTHQTAPTPRL
jgi:DnaK suppressor protein